LAKLLLRLLDKSLTHPTFSIFPANPLVIGDLLARKHNFIPVLEKGFTTFSLHFFNFFLCKAFKECVSSHLVKLRDLVTLFMLTNRVLVNEHVNMVRASFVSLLELIIQDL